MAGESVFGLIRRFFRALVGSPAPKRTRPSRPPVGAYPGDFIGVPTISYAPRADNSPDPGEVVWTWVPFEEDHTQGKDRPVLIIGSDGPWLLGLALTSKDHVSGRYASSDRWMDVGVGSWDKQGRPSEVRVDRVIRIDPRRVRRMGGKFPKSVFAQVAGAVIANAKRR